MVSAAVTVALLAGPAGFAHGQDAGEADDASIQAGPVALSPTIRLTNIGYDSNVFNKNDANNPTSDFTSTVSPAVDVRLRLPGARLSGRSELDFIYFKELQHLRSVDTVNSLRAELLLSRLQPYVGGVLSNTLHRTNLLEIDDPVRVLDDTFVAGAEVRITGKSSIDIRAQRSVVKYDDDAVYLDSDLSRNLNRTMTGEGLTFRYAATPLTTIGLDVQQQRDRFEFSPERDTDRLRISPLIEFHPHALISGRALFGIDRRTYIGHDASEARGSIMLVDLRYTLLGRTQFAVLASRDLHYSYLSEREEYQQAGVTVSVAQRLADPWDVRGWFGRHRLTYLTEAAGGAAAASADQAEDETVFSYGVDVGYRVGRTRLSVRVAYRERHSNESLSREYQRLRVTSSLAFPFN